MTIALAFLGGLISCLSPCVLPVLPVFVSYVGGPRVAFAGGGTETIGIDHSRSRAAGFLIGFAGVFVLLWVSLGLVGFALIQSVPLFRPVAGAAIAGLGIATLIGWRLPIGMGRWASSRSAGGSLLFGAGIALGWTPCIGPTLGAILTMAAAASSVWAGGILLVAYALGMTVPFVAVAFGLSRARPLTRLIGAHHDAFRVMTGVLIIGVGLLVATNLFSRLAGLVPWTF